MRRWAWPQRIRQLKLHLRENTRVSDLGFDDERGHAAGVI